MLTAETRGVFAMCKILICAHVDGIRQIKLICHLYISYILFIGVEESAFFMGRLVRFDFMANFIEPKFLRFR